MPFVDGDNVCVFVPPCGGALETIDVGDIAACHTSSAEYDVDQEEAGVTICQKESHLFQVAQGAKVKKKAPLTGFTIKATYYNDNGRHRVVKDYYTKTGSKIRQS